jgi:hypothetical protein
MPYFFDRIARVEIGTKSSVYGLVVNTPLRIAFEINKNALDVTNSMTLTINNLKDESRNQIRYIPKKPQQINVFAGYRDQGEPSLIFAGEITRVTHDLAKNEVETKIIAMDGHSAVHGSKISVAFKKGKPINTIINHAIAAIGLPINFDPSILPATPTKGTYSHTGKAWTWLVKLCNENDLHCSIQNGSIKIFKSEGVDNVGPLQSVIIGSPRKLEENPYAPSLTEFSGYEIEARLMSKAEPGSLVEFTSRDVTKKTRLQVKEVHHEGDSHGEKWTTTLKGKEIV